MSYEYTGKALGDGRPIWECKTCHRKVWGFNPGKHSCKPDDSAKPATVPCKSRGLPMGKAGSACCRVVLYGCSKHGKCTIKAAEPEIQNCLSCLERD